MLGAVRRGVFGRFDVGRGKGAGAVRAAACPLCARCAERWGTVVSCLWARRLGFAAGGGEAGVLGGGCALLAAVAGGVSCGLAGWVAGWRAAPICGAGGKRMRCPLRWGLGVGGDFSFCLRAGGDFPFAVGGGARRKGAGRRDVQYALLLPLRRRTGG